MGGGGTARRASFSKASSLSLSTRIAEMTPIRTDKHAASLLKPSRMAALTSFVADAAATFIFSFNSLVPGVAMGTSYHSFKNGATPRSP